MASDAEAMFTINNATIFPVVTDAAVGSVDPTSDVWFYREATRTLTRQQQRLTKFLVAHVSCVDDPVSVIQYNAQLFPQTFIFAVFLWLWCLRRFDVTFGYVNVRNCVTLWCLFTNTPSDKRASVSLVS